MAITDNEELYHKPCCSLLKEQSRLRESLSDPAVCTELLACMAKHCVLMKIAGDSKVKFDAQQGQCYLLVDPTSARQILNEVSETITLEGLTDYYDILNKIESSIAKNPLLKEVADHHTFLLATMREHEKKFGGVPLTIEKSAIQPSEGLERQKGFEDHPLLSGSPQFDGAPPSQTAVPNDNPSSVAEVNRLQLQHQPKPGFNPTPSVLRPGPS
jgi:hypothetical protein